MKPLLTIVALVFATGCAEPGPTTGTRWYTQEQVVQGAAIFQANCASCHGEEAQGIVADWRSKLSDGSYPAPPLDGSAHAWHHPLQVLTRTTRDGGVPMGGTMPPFKDKLNDREIEAAISYFQSKWSEQIYESWAARNG